MVIEMMKQMKWFLLVQGSYLMLSKNTVNDAALALMKNNNKDLEQIDTLEQELEN